MFTNQLFKKRNFLAAMHGFSFLLSFIVSNHAAAQNQKPNIILILADDVGYKSLTCNGGNLYSTPNIDTLAKQGIRFTQCHASAKCAPSRFMLLTGKYNFRNYTHGGMGRDQKTIANMMKDAGYQTAVFGKWQLDGGDLSVHTFGFDNYCLWNPYASEIKTAGFKYKNPEIFTHGDYLPDNKILNKYGPDIVSDSLLSFINNNKSKPFFIYYPMMLVHSPFNPTPDDTAFANWDPTDRSDTSFFRTMMHYMDKKIGELTTRLKNLGIENNTVILFAGDNGTPRPIPDFVDDNDDSLVFGGKQLTTEAGTHVPLIAYWPGKIKAGTVNNDLIDFTDFLPSISGVAEIPLPTNYGPLDGVSFFPQLTGQPGTPRNWIFNHYNPNVTTFARWAQTRTYKLYDTSSSKPERLFYNIDDDAKEKLPIADASLTDQEAIIKQQLLDVINGYVAQGTPLISLNPSISSVTDSSVVLKDTINANGGSTVTASGAVWSTSPNPVISSASYTLTGKSLGSFSTLIKGLTANTTYYIRAYATNFGGTAYSNQIIFKTSSVPVATAATEIDSNKFVANWEVYAAAKSYKLDVSTSPSFTQINTPTITEGFNNGITPSAGWTISNNIIANTAAFGTASPSLEFTASNAQIVTTQLSGPAVQLSFWIKGLNTNQTSSLLVEGFDGNNWIAIATLTGLPKNGAKKTFSATSSPALSQNFIQFRFTYIQKAGTLVFDDISIKYANSVPFFVTGYNNLAVSTNSKIVSGLNPATNYYYRVRAVTKTTTTGNSNVITATSCKAAVITNINKLNLICNGSANGSIAVTVTGGVIPLAYSWTGPDNFTSSDKDINNLTAGVYHLKITSNGGCAVDTNITITQPQALTATANAGAINCNGETTILTVSTQGGMGSYQYTLSDGTGPQVDNHFTVGAGTYTVTVTDSNGCSFTTETVQVTEPQALTATANAGMISCYGGTTTLTVSAQGGTGNYHYTLSDGTGPQDDNHFTIVAGTYTVTVTDDNSCSFTTDPLHVDDGTDPCGTITSVTNKDNQVHNLKTKKNNEQLNVYVYPNPSLTEFVLKVKTAVNKTVEISVTDMHGKKIYYTKVDHYDKHLFGKEFMPGAYIVTVIQGKNIKTLKLIKGK